MENRANRSRRVYRFLLRLFPFDFQREYGEEMETVFRDEHKHQNRTRLWWRTVIGFLRTAPSEHLDVFRCDMRYGLRSLAKRPLAAVIMLSVLAIGIGANTAVFSVMNLMLIRPLPVPYPERVVRITSGSAIGNVTYDDYLQFRDQNRTVSELAAFQDEDITFRADGPPEALVATIVTGNYFETLAVPALLGRVLQKSDDRRGAPGVVLLSEDFWRSRFGMDPTVVGRAVRVDGTLFTVVGVTPESFGGADRDVSRDLWIPWNSPRRSRPGNAHMIGRLRDGSSVRQAQADFSVIASQFNEQRPTEQRTMSVDGARMVPPILSRRLIPLVAVFTALAGLSLLVPCLNIGNVLLVQSAERRREMGIRLALGAGRGQLLRQVLTESVLIGICAGVLGLGIFAATIGILVSSFEMSAAYASRLVLDWHVAAFTLAISLATTVMFGLAPALHSAKNDVLPALKQGESAGPATRSRLRAGLIISQVAISALLLALSGLFVRSLTGLVRHEHRLDHERRASGKSQPERWQIYTGTRYRILRSFAPQLTDFSWIELSNHD